MVLGGILDFDRQVYPTLRTGLVTAQQIEAYRQVIAANPIAKQYAKDDQIVCFFKSAQILTDRGLRVERISMIF